MNRPLAAGWLLGLFGERRSGAIVLDSQEYERRVLQTRSVGVLLGVGHAWCTVRQVFAELVARHDDDPDVNAAVAEGGIQVDHVHDQKITSGRNLHFNADADLGTVHNFALDPVHVARHFLCPAAEPVELLVDEFSNGSATVGILFLLDQQLKAS